MIDQNELIQTLIERSIVERLRLAAVAAGYLPDQTAYPNITDYRTAITAIANGAAGFAVEVFGHSNSQDKGIKKVPRIAYIPGRVVPGDVGLEFTATYEPVYEGEGDLRVLTQWLKKKIPMETGDFQFEIHIVTETAEQHRILNHIFHKALGMRRFIPLYNDLDQLFFVEVIGFYDTPDTTQGVTETVYNMQAKDLYVYEGDTLGTIAKIAQITLEITPVGRAVLLETGGLAGEAPSESILFNLNPYMLKDNIYRHTGDPSHITGIIPNLSAAQFISIERGVTPIHAYLPTQDPKELPPNGFYYINPNNTLTISPQITPGETLHYIMQL
jgi:hypothetical protein